VALWRHFPVDDQSPDQLAAACLAFQAQFDFDFIKITPASSFCLKDWGVQDQWAGNPEGTREYTHQVVQQPEDWTSLPVLNVHAGSLGAQLECLRMLKQAVPTHTPILQTVFSPLAQAKNLAGRSRFLEHLHTTPEAVAAGLAAIAMTTRRFVEAVVEIGADGVFYAIQHAQSHLLSPSEFEQFSRPVDLTVLEPAGALWFNMAHIHGENILFDQVKDYPVAVLNWHDRQTSPSLAEALDSFPGVVCGGLRQWETLVYGTAEDVRAEARQAIQATGSRRFILSTGCVAPVITPYGNLMAARLVVEGTNR
jgi:uroporphyrinogen decarboxylase